MQTDFGEMLRRDGRIEIGLRRRRLGCLFVGSVVFLVVCLGILVSATSAGDRVMGTLAVGLCALCVAVFGVQLRQRGPAVVVDGQGIHATYPRGDATIPWEAALGAFVYSVRGTHLVTLHVPAEFMATYLEGRGGATRGLAKLQRGMLGGDTISLPAPLDVDHDAFAAWLDAEAARRRD